jgi:hypothetical protein
LAELAAATDVAFGRLSDMSRQASAVRRYKYS